MPLAPALHATRRGRRARGRESRIDGSSRSEGGIAELRPRRAKRPRRRAKGASSTTRLFGGTVRDALCEFAAVDAAVFLSRFPSGTLRAGRLLFDTARASDGRSAGPYPAPPGFDSQLRLRATSARAYTPNLPVKQVLTKDPLRPRNSARIFSADVGLDETVSSVLLSRAPDGSIRAHVESAAPYDQVWLDGRTCAKCCGDLGPTGRFDCAAPVPDHPCDQGARWSCSRDCPI